MAEQPGLGLLQEGHCCSCTNGPVLAAATQANVLVVAACPIFHGLTRQAH